MKLQAFTLTAGIAVTSLLAGVTPFAHAATISTDKTSFVNNLQSGYYLNNFESLTTGQKGTTESFGASGFNYSITGYGSTQGNQLYVSPATGGLTQAFSTNASGTGMLINFTSGNVTAVGGDFFLSNLSGNLIAGDLTINLSDGTSETFSSTTSTAPPFRGFTTTGSTFITSLDLLAFTPVDPFKWNTIDNLYVGRANTAVPEPFTIVGTLVGGTAALRMRKKLKSSGKV